MTQATVDRLKRDREDTYRKLGQLSDNVVGRNLRNYDDPRPYLWPSSPMGCLRMIRRKRSVMLVTDGLSDPWDAEIHESVPDWTFGFELAVEVPNSDLPGTSEAEILQSWMGALLIAATDCIVVDRFDLVGRVYQFELATTAVPPVHGLEEYLLPEGYMRGFVGIPVVGDVGTSVTLAEEDDGNPIALLTIKMMTPDEVEAALNGPQEVTIAMANALLERGDRHLMWPGRPSIIQQPQFREPKPDWIAT
jgi:hypothetical protein